MNEHASGPVPPFFKDPTCEQAVSAMNQLLVDLEARLIEGFTVPPHPTIFICGAPRSGTTLVLQLLIAAYHIGYVTNLTARFWEAPYLGALISLDLQKRKRVGSTDLKSVFGATYGFDGPHEFGFFWRKWFPYSADSHAPCPEQLGSIDYSVLRKELAALQSLTGTPWAFKNPIVFSLNIERLAREVPGSLFVICKRDPVYVSQSLLESREQRFGKRDTWFSVKPPEYDWLKDLPPWDQVAGQVFFTEKRIDEAVRELEPLRVLTVDYPDLCREPAAQLARVGEAIAGLGGDLAPTGYQPEPLESTDVVRIGTEGFEKLAEAYRRLAEGAD